MRRGKPRVLGPYFENEWWRVVIREGGRRVARKVASEEAARSLKAALEASLETEQPLGLEDVLVRYEQHLAKKGNKPSSVKATLARLRNFMRGVAELPQLTQRKAISLYERLRTAPSERTGKPLAADSHRNILAEAKTFGAWVVKQKLLRNNPFADIEPTGRRKHGKPQLRIDEARAFCRVAHDLAAEGDAGAVAALTALLMGLRAGEIVSRTVRDVDDAGRMLWITDSKTRAGKRQVMIPAVLQPYYQRLIEGRTKTDWLFGEHWRDWPRHQVQRICKLARVPTVCAHSMRGLHSTVAIQAGASPHLVAATLGHTSASVTLESYAAPGSHQVQQQQLVTARLGWAPPPEIVPKPFPKEKGRSRKGPAFVGEEWS